MPMPTQPRAHIQNPYTESLTASVPEMAQTLQEIAGQRLTAYAVHTKTPKTIGRWASGESEARDLAQIRRLRVMFRVVRTLTESPVSDETVRAWLMSPNPNLGEQVPIDALRDDDCADVLGAAQEFAGS